MPHGVVANAPLDTGWLQFVTPKAKGLEFASANDPPFLGGDGLQRARDGRNGSGSGPPTMLAVRYAALSCRLPFHWQVRIDQPSPRAQIGHRIPAKRLGCVINCVRSGVEFGSRRPMRADGTQVRTEGRPMGAHQGFVAWTRRPCWGDCAGQPLVRRGGAVPVPGRHPVARPARAFRGFSGGASAPFAMEQDRGLATHLQDLVERRRQRVRDDRFDYRPSPPAQLRGNTPPSMRWAIRRAFI